MNEERTHCDDNRLNISVVIWDIDNFATVKQVGEIMLGTTSSGISYQLRDMYSICCWNIATYINHLFKSNLFLKFNKRKFHEASICDMVY